MQQTGELPSDFGQNIAAACPQKVHHLVVCRSRRPSSICTWMLDVQHCCPAPRGLGKAVRALLTAVRTCLGQSEPGLLPLGMQKGQQSKAAMQTARGNSSISKTRCTCWCRAAAPSAVVGERTTSCQVCQWPAPQLSIASGSGRASHPDLLPSTLGACPTMARSDQPWCLSNEFAGP